MSERVRSLLSSADKQEQQSKWDEALSLYNQVLEKDPDNEDACYKSAAIYALRGLIPEVINKYFQLMDISEKSGNLDQAIEVAGWIQKIQPSNDQARLRTILIYQKKKDVEKIVKSSVQLARLYIELGRGDESIMLLRNAQETSPENLDIALELADVYMRHGHINEAASQYRSVGSSYLQNRNVEKAVEAFRSIKVITAEDPQLLLLLGNLYLVLQRYNEAEIEYRAVLRLDLSNSQALMSLGAVCQLKGQYRDAILAFGKILSIDTQEVRAREKLGELYQAQGNHVEAIKNYLSAANIYQSMEENEKAIKLYQRVISLDPTNPTSCRELTNLGAPLEGNEDEEIFSPFRPEIPGLPDDYVYEPNAPSAPSASNAPLTSPVMPDMLPSSNAGFIAASEEKPLQEFGKSDNLDLRDTEPSKYEQEEKPKDRYSDEKPRDRYSDERSRDRYSDENQPTHTEKAKSDKSDADKMSTALLIPKDSAASRLIPKSGKKVGAARPVMGQTEEDEEDSLKAPLLRTKSSVKKGKPTLSATPKKQLFSRKDDPSDMAIAGNDAFSADSSKSKLDDDVHSFELEKPQESSFTPDFGTSFPHISDDPNINITDIPTFSEVPQDLSSDMPSFGGSEFSGFGSPPQDMSSDIPDFGSAEFSGFGRPPQSLSSDMPSFGGSEFSGFGEAPQGLPSDSPSFGSAEIPGFGETPQRLPSDVPSFGGSEYSGFGSSPQSMSSDIPSFGGSEYSGFGSPPQSMSSDIPSFGGSEYSGFGEAPQGLPSDSPSFDNADIPGFGDTPQRLPSDVPSFGSSEFPGFGEAPQSMSSDMPGFGSSEFPGFGETPQDMSSNMPGFGSAEFSGFGEAPQGISSDMPSFGNVEFPGFGEAPQGLSSDMPSFGNVEFPGFGEAPQGISSDMPGFGNVEFPGFGEASQGISSEFPGFESAGTGLDGRSQPPLLDSSIFSQSAFPDISSGSQLGFESSSESSIFASQSSLPENPNVSFASSSNDPFSFDGGIFSSAQEQSSVFSQNPLLALDNQSLASDPFASDPYGSLPSIDSISSESLSGYEALDASAAGLNQSAEPAKALVGKDFNDLPAPIAYVSDNVLQDSSDFSGEVASNKRQDLTNSLREKIDSGELSEALEIFKNLLEENPLDRELRMELAELYFTNALVGESIEQYKILLEKDPENIDFLVRIMTAALWNREISLAEETMLAIARIYMRNNETLISLEYYQSILAVNPDNIEAREELIDIYSKQKIDKAAVHHLNMIGRISIDNISPERAMTLLKKVYDLTKSEDVFMRLAESYEKSGLMDDAISSYTELLNRFKERNDVEKTCIVLEKLKLLQPSDISVYQELSNAYRSMNDGEKIKKNEFDLGNYYISADKIDEAMKIFEGLIELDPSYKEARQNLIDIYIDKEFFDKAFEQIKVLAEQYKELGELKKASFLYIRILSVDQNNIQARREIISIFLEIGDKEKTLEQLTALAEKYSELEQWQNAAGTYGEIIELDPSLNDKRFQMASILKEHTGSIEQAIVLFADNFDRDPLYFENTKKYVNTLFELRKSSEAMQVMNRLIEQDESYKSFRDEIVSSYKKKVNESDNVSDRFNLGVIYKELGLVDNAIEQFQKTKRSDEFMAASSIELALCFARKPGMLLIGIRTLNKALEESNLTDKDTNEMKYVLAGLYESAGKTEEALKIYKEFDPDFKDVSSKIELLGK